MIECCLGIASLLEPSNERGFAIYVSDCNGRPAFYLQHRPLARGELPSVDIATASGQRLMAMIGQIPMTFVLGLA